MSELDFTAAPGIGTPEERAVGPEAARRADTVAGDTIAGDMPGARLANPGAEASDDEFDRSLRPRTLDEFVGQPRMREQMRVFVDATRLRDEPLDHALFAGPPGLGKCVTPDTLLLTTQGMVPIASLGDLAGESWQPITRPVAGLYGLKIADYFYNNGESATVRVTTRSGYRLEGTPNHPVLVRDRAHRMQFRRLCELERGDEVAVRLGAQLFGSSTRLHVEGLKPQTLDDPAVLPAELTDELARVLGLMLGIARIADNGTRVVAATTSDTRADELATMFQQVFCVPLDDHREGTFGRTLTRASPRIASFLQGLGMTERGFEQCPEVIYKAPRLIVASFLQGVMWGADNRSWSFTRRPMASHLQLMFANFGIETTLAQTCGERFTLQVHDEPARFERPSHRALPAEPQVSHNPPRRSGSYFTREGESGSYFTREVRAATESARASAMATQSMPGSLPLPGFDAEPDVAFGATAAGVLVALPHSAHARPSGHAADSAAALSSISVAEVEPLERTRALTRRRREGLLASDSRALAVRSVKSPLREHEAVELVWEPVVEIESGYAHTCDVSVPDGHTFVGNGIVCHNTTLAHVVANELGATMHQTSGPALEKKADVAAILTSLSRNDVLFIDEIHRLNSSIEEVLYTAMEDYQIDIVLGQGPSARTLRLDLEPFTLVGATTRTGLLTTPLRDRFGMIHRLDYYDVDELTTIVKRSAGMLGLSVEDTAAAEIAGRSRGTPRIANRLLKRVRDVAQVRHQGAVTLDIAREALDLVDIDAAGLDRVDRHILEFILHKFGGGPVGLSTLSVAIGEEPDTIEDVYEPYLLQRGLLQRTPRGRVITRLGREHLGVVEAPHAPPLF